MTDLNPYLPTDVLEWVTLVLEEEGHQIPTTWTEDHLSSYQLLRCKVQDHVSKGNHQPELKLLSKPLGALNWEPVPVVENNNHIHTGDLWKYVEGELEDIRQVI